MVREENGIRHSKINPVRRQPKKHSKGYMDDVRKYGYTWLLFQISAKVVTISCVIFADQKRCARFGHRVYSIAVSKLPCELT